MQQVIFRDIGLMDYKQAWDYQEKLFATTVYPMVVTYNWTGVNSFTNTH